MHQVGGSVFESGFLTQVAPLLEKRDYPALLTLFKRRFPLQTLVDMLSSGSTTVVRAAVSCVGLIGGMDQTPRLVALLGHADAEVVRRAEDALWSIWMRAGSESATRQLSVAVAKIKTGEHAAASRLLASLVSAEPTFAEAHHQLAIAEHLQNRLDTAEPAYQRALELNAYHFAAAAGLGHVYAERDNLAAALRAYRRALHIHPNLTEIREVVPRLEAAVSGRIVV
jgi:tetratricopeptide (TPR) repeat protein